MGPVDEQFAHKTVPLFADPQVGVVLSRLIKLRSESKKRPRMATSGESMGVFDREHISQRQDRPHPFDLSQNLGLWILLAQLLDFLVIAADLLSQPLHHLQDRFQGLL